MFVFSPNVDAKLIKSKKPKAYEECIKHPVWFQGHVFHCAEVFAMWAGPVSRAQIGPNPESWAQIVPSLVSQAQNGSGRVLQVQVVPGAVLQAQIGWC